MAKFKNIDLKKRIDKRLKKLKLEVMRKKLLSMYNESIIV